MDNNAPNTNNFLNWVEIKNFKSIKDLWLDCKRVNVFIGKPNVGKSNILEGLGLLGASYSDEKFMGGMVRYKELKHLYNDSDILNKDIEIITNRRVAIIHSSVSTPQSEPTFRLLLANHSAYEDYKATGYKYTVLEQHTGTQLISINVNGDFNYINTEESKVFDTNSNSVKKYDFVNLTQFQNSFSDFLLPPYGPNFYEVVRRNKGLWSEFAKLFTEQQLELVLYDEKQEFILQKKDGPYVTQYPYFSIADTFRRFMFYIAAIESNKNSVLIFEEPEVHSFPPYTQEMAYRMIYDEDNQYFISTHSPYMLHPFIEKMDYKDLNVFITYYKDYQTHVRALTEEELTDILDYSTNVFFNLRKFEPNA